MSSDGPRRRRPSGTATRKLSSSSAASHSLSSSYSVSVALLADDARELDAALSGRCRRVKLFPPSLSDRSGMADDPLRLALPRLLVLTTLAARDMERLCGLSDALD